MKRFATVLAVATVATVGALTWGEADDAMDVADARAEYVSACMEAAFGADRASATIEQRVYVRGVCRDRFDAGEDLPE